MKKFAMILAIIMVAVVSIFDGDASGLVLAAAPLATQQGVFLNQLKTDYENIEKEWLNGVDDFSRWVEDNQQVKFPEGGVSPAVYKDRTTDVDSVEPEETVHSENLVTYDSQNYKLRRISMYALPFDKKAFYTKKSAEAIVEQELKDACYNFAAKEAKTKSIIYAATGTDDGTFKTFSFDDLKKLAELADSKIFPKKGRKLILPSDMWWALVNSSTLLTNQVQNMPNTGNIEIKLVNALGFTIYKSLGDMYKLGYDTSTSKKAAQGAEITGNVVPAATFFCDGGVFKASGDYKMSAVDFANNPTGRAYEFGFQHRALYGKQYNDEKYTGLIYLPKKG